MFVWLRVKTKIVYFDYIHEFDVREERNQYMKMSSI